MATFTENYSLIKPDQADYYDVTDWNENMDTIDALMADAQAETAAGLAEISGKIGSPTGESQTLFSLLQGTASGGFTAIKSLQKVVFNSSISTSSTLAISPVTPENCFVIMERMYDTSTRAANKCLYTLNADSLTLEHYGDASSSVLVIGFWIIELM